MNIILCVLLIQSTNKEFDSRKVTLVFDNESYDSVNKRLYLTWHNKSNFEVKYGNDNFTLQKQIGRTWKSIAPNPTSFDSLMQLFTVSTYSQMEQDYFLGSSAETLTTGNYRFSTDYTVSNLNGSTKSLAYPIIIEFSIK